MFRQLYSYISLLFTKTKFVQGPISKKKMEIIASGTSVDQEFRVNAMDKLAQIGITVSPGTDFELHQVSNDTFTLGKKDIYICLDSVGEDFNTLVYVFLHELSHVVCKTCMQHDANFVSVFKQLRDTAQRNGMYRPTTVRAFCGK